MPAPGVSSIPRTDLPNPLTRLVGREREIADLRALLVDEGVRLITLTGPGGVGKTRLALEVASSVEETFSDGARFVPLAPVTDPALVLLTIARALGIREAGEEPLIDRLTAALRGQESFLGLDNFEQVVEAAPLVAELLAACPNLVVLVTSRVRLRLSGEREYPVSPLPLPDSQARSSVNVISGSGAVRLFTERARAVKPSFTLTSENASAVAEICQRLDGLPLALELAAARVKMLTAPALVARMERTLPLLTGGARDLPIRQQTMRDAIAWSYNLLTREEQRLFCRVAVFVGGFTLDGVDAVASAAGDPGMDPFEGIASLVDKSLVQPFMRNSGEPRYFMLETVREYAQEQLDASGESEATRNAHAAYYLTLAEWAEARFWRGAPGDWQHQPRIEHDNFRAALAWGTLRWRRMPVG